MTVQEAAAEMPSPSCEDRQRSEGLVESGGGDSVSCLDVYSVSCERVQTSTFIETQRETETRVGDV